MHNLCNISWFCGHDLWIDLFSAATLLLIAFFSFRYYSLDKKKKEFWLAVAFSIIAVGFLFNILTNFTIYTHVLETEKLGSITVVEHEYRLSPILQTVGYLVFRVLMILGLYTLFSIRTDNSKATNVLMGLFIVVAVFFSRSSYYVSHCLALVLLALITHQYYTSYMEKKNKNTRCLLWGFAAIASSQILFMFVLLNPMLYVVAELVQLVGYFLLLITLIRILYYAKKKNKN